MTFSDFRCHTTPLFAKLKILKARDVIKLQQLKLIYEFKQDLLPDDLQSLFKLDTDVHNYETCSSSKKLLHIPEIHSLTYGNKSIKYHCPYLWNSMFKIIYLSMPRKK